MNLVCRANTQSYYPKDIPEVAWLRTEPWLSSLGSCQGKGSKQEL